MLLLSWISLSMSQNPRGILHFQHLFNILLFLKSWGLSIWRFIQTHCISPINITCCKQRSFSILISFGVLKRGIVKIDWSNSSATTCPSLQFPKCLFAVYWGIHIWLGFQIKRTLFSIFFCRSPRMENWCSVLHMFRSADSSGIPTTRIGWTIA